MSVRAGDEAVDFYGQPGPGGLKIYMASSWRNKGLDRVAEVLRGAGHSVFDFRWYPNGSRGFHWSEQDVHWRSWSPRRFVQALDDPRSVHGFLRDAVAMRQADACVLVLPCGRSAHLEAGAFAGVAGTPRLVIYYPPSETRDPQEPELMYRLAYGIALDEQELLTALCALGTELSLPAASDERDV